jgi:hypothetical protein
MTILSEDDDLGLEVVKKATSRSKYKKLNSLLQFQDNDVAKENINERSLKIGPLTETTNFAFQQFGTVEEHLSADEMVVKYY